MKKNSAVRVLPIVLIVAVLFFSAHLSSLFAEDDRTTILIIGDSLSAGLGVAPEQAYPSLLQNKLAENGKDGINIINGSISGSTSAGAYSRLKWYLRAKPDLLVLALGANDGLRGLSVDLMRQNLEKAVELARDNQIPVILAGMRLPPNYGPDYAQAFENSFAELSEKHDLPFIPFLLKNVAGRPALNQADGIHPNAQGHKIIAETVFPVLMEHL